MKRSQLLCPDLDAARKNRDRVKTKVGEDFYRQQERLLAQWKLGERPPIGLVLGKLPCPNPLPKHPISKPFMGDNNYD